MLQQKYSGDFEIIVVDNNCTDDTVSIAQSYGVRVVSEERPGVCWARQAGTEVANGEIVISTDADTIQPENWLENIDQSFKKSSDCVAVAGSCRFGDGPWWGKQYPKLLFGLISLIYKIIGRPIYITATNTAFKKSAWTKYHTNIAQGGDELALLHDLKKEGKIVFDNTNPVYTSARRLSRGLVYNIFVTFIFYYLICYYLDRIFGRTLIGNAPAYRDSVPRRNTLSFAYLAVFLVLLVSVVHLPGHDTVVQQSYETFTYIKDKIF